MSNSKVRDTQLEQNIKLNTAKKTNMSESRSL